MVSSLLEMFNYFKTILCMCPNCNNLLRLSELHLRSKDRAPRTWLDDYELRVQKIENQENKFSQIETELREKSKERGRAQVPKLISKSMDPKFAKLKFDPYDIKALLHPIDFVVFDGMNKGSMNQVVLLSRKTSNPYLQKLHHGIAKAVQQKDYDWQVVRVSQDGNVVYE